MSPEQVDGEAEIDGRSDIYSLACTLYEMLSGRPPFIGTPNAVMRQQLSARPRPLASLCAGMPPRLDAALLRALDKSPERRYATAGEFIASLVNGTHRMRVIGRRVAVIPFVHACARPTVDTVSDTVGEEVAVALRDFDGIVIAPNASCGCDAPGGHMIDIARRAGADVVLLGDVRRNDDGAGVLITAMLFDGRTGRRIWSGASAGQQDDGFLSSDGPAREIAKAIAAALGARRLRDRVEASSATTASFAAPKAVRTGTDERPVVH